MRAGLRFVAFLGLIVFISILGSFQVMERLERRWFTGDLARRSRLIFESTRDYLVENAEVNRRVAIHRLLNRISRDERLMGAMLCSPEGTLIARADALPAGVSCDLYGPGAVRESASVREVNGALLHEAAFPLSNEGGQALGTLVLLHDTSYIGQRHRTTRAYLVALLVGVSFFLSIVALVLYRRLMSDSVLRLRSVFAGLMTGDADAVRAFLSRREYSPLARDVSQVMRRLRAMKQGAEPLEPGPAWTPARLRHEVQRLFGDSQLCVIANREPYVHNRKGGKIEVMFPASGLVTAVEPIVRACSGLWIAHGSGTADRETADSHGKLLVPPGNPEYALKRVWLTKEEERGYYYGFSNEGMWPLCHIAHARPHFGLEDWRQYSAVNEKFADAFLSENPGPSPIVLIQDYHFAILPELIRSRRPDSILTVFWHIPWPNPEAFGICPWKKELLQGMLAADLIGFHTQFHCNNFLDTVDRFLEARVDREQFSVTIQGHVCHVKPFPISIEWPSRHRIPVESFAEERRDLLDQLNLPQGTLLGVGVDRVDYTKGIVERMRSVERLLERRPELAGKFVFVQIGAPSRTHIKRYQDLNAEVQEVADEINWKFHRADVPPILLKLAHHEAPEIFKYYRAADVCFVSSLHDGMNLVAKEYVSAREDVDGVLVLSDFAGASRELTQALRVNPYDIEECAEALHRALVMTREERRSRMGDLRKTVSERNVYHWASTFLGEIHRIAQSRRRVSEGFGA